MPRGPLGLPRTRRLRRRSEFDAVRQSGHKLRDPFFLVSAIRTERGARLGMAVSRRVSSKAIIRNRVKRQIRESFRVHRKILHGLDIVVVAQTAAGSVANAVLTQSLRTHWHRLIAKCVTR